MVIVSPVSHMQDHRVQDHRGLGEALAPAENAEHQHSQGRLPSDDAQQYVRYD